MRRSSGSEPSSIAVHRRARAAVALAGLSLVAGCAGFPFLQPAPEPPPPPPPVDTLRWTAPEAAAGTPSDAAGLDRLLRLARVWTAVRWFHPAVAAEPTAWEVAYLTHVDRVRAAGDEAAFEAAVAAMLATLGDPDTRITAVRPDSLVRRCTVLGETASAAPDGVIDWRGDPADCPEGGMSAAAERAASRRPPSAATRTRAAALEARLGEVERWRLVRAGVLGSPPPRPDGAPTGDASLEWRVRAPAASAGAAVGARETASAPASAGANAGPLVMVVDRDTRIEPEVLRAQQRGDVRIVHVGDGAARTTLGAMHVPFGSGREVRIRVEALGAARDRRRALRPDTTMAGSDSAVFAWAGAVAAGTAPAPRRAARRRTVHAVRPGDPAYPSLPERLLVLTQSWGLARLASPYAALADRDLDAVAAEAFGAAERADAPRQWAGVLTRFFAALDAGQAAVSTPVHPEYGQSVGAAPFDVAFVGETALLTRVDSAALPGVAAGDVLLALGGEPIDKRVGRWRPLLGGSNGWTRERRAARMLGRGPAGATITARFALASGGTIERQVTYGAANAAPVARETPAWRGAPFVLDTVAPGIVRIGGEAQPLRFLGRVPEADSSWRRLRTDARGLVIDLRGGARGDVARRLAPELASVPVVWGHEEVLRHETTPGSRPWLPFDSVGAVVRRDRILTPASDTGGFGGPLAVLVDASTIGPAEETAAMLRGSGTVRALVGTTSAGMVGGVALARLWGGVPVAFPVSALTTRDDRIWQRVGLAPDVYAAPTLDGVRAGRDEVLEAAVAWIEARLAAPER